MFGLFLLLFKLLNVDFNRGILWSGLEVLWFEKIISFFCLIVYYFEFVDLFDFICVKLLLKIVKVFIFVFGRDEFLGGVLVFKLYELCVFWNKLIIFFFCDSFIFSDVFIFLGVKVYILFFILVVV